MKYLILLVILSILAACGDPNYQLQPTKTLVFPVYTSATNIEKLEIKETQVIEK